MTDRELLELAAKALGYRYTVNKADAGWLCTKDSTGLDGHLLWWKPLFDDGDALRLMVACSLHIGLESHVVSAWHKDRFGHFFTEEFGDGDPYAATRRAIVRAAAEIGKAMP